MGPTQPPGSPFPRKTRETSWDVREEASVLRQRATSLRVRRPSPQSSSFSTGGIICDDFFVMGTVTEGPRRKKVGSTEMDQWTEPTVT